MIERDGCRLVDARRRLRGGRAAAGGRPGPVLAYFPVTLRSAASVVLPNVMSELSRATSW